jgi:hypothetical protein
LLLSVAALGTPISVPDGDFSSTTNAGTVGGGGLLGASGTNVAIGTTGPWTGTYTGVLTVVAPPALTIDSSAQQATISGILGLSVLNALVANSGSFDQIFPSADSNNLYKASKIYRLSVNVDTPAIVGVDLLSNGVAGAALTQTNGGGVTTTAASTLSQPATLTLLSAGHYKLTLQYASPGSGSIIGRRIGVSLLSKPQGLASLSLVSSIDFSNVTLDRYGTIPSSVSVTIGSQSGTQTATVGEAFDHPLSVTVVDSDGDAVPGVNVTFEAPASGPSATFSPATTVMTGDDGTATVDATAGTVAGSYNVTATVSGVVTPATFDLTNAPGAPASIAIIPPPPTSAAVGTAFAPLSVHVTDMYGNDVADGTTITATASSSAGGATTQSPVLMSTTTAGIAEFDEVANTVAGEYDLDVTSGSAASDTLPMQNTAGPPTQVKPGVNNNAAASGTPQTATITQPFALPLTVLVTDEFDNPVSGATVDFATPMSGAGANLSSSTPMTDANGVAAVSAVANSDAGAYEVVASVLGGTTSMTFNLTNTGAVTTIVSGTPQIGEVGTQYGCALIAQVTDVNGPVAGIDVEFTANPSQGGASGTLSSVGGSENTSPLTVPTDGDGLAVVEATGNAIIGTYTVTAEIPGTGQSAIFQLTSLGIGERVFYDGFELPCGGIPAPRP